MKIEKDTQRLRMMEKTVACLLAHSFARTDARTPRSYSSSPHAPTRSECHSNDSYPPRDRVWMSQGTSTETTDLCQRLLEDYDSIPGLFDPRPEVAPGTEEKIKHFLNLKAQGTHFNEQLYRNFEYKNPNIYKKLIDFMGLDEYTTNDPLGVKREGIQTDYVQLGEAVMAAYEAKQRQGVSIPTTIPQARIRSSLGASTLKETTPSSSRTIPSSRTMPSSRTTRWDRP